MLPGTVRDNVLYAIDEPRAGDGARGRAPRLERSPNGRPASCPGASGRAWRSRGRWRASPRCCCSTSPRPRSTTTRRRASARPSASWPATASPCAWRPTTSSSSPRSPTVRTAVAATSLDQALQVAPRRSRSASRGGCGSDSRASWPGRRAGRRPAHGRRRDHRPRLPRRGARVRVRRRHAATAALTSGGRLARLPGARRRVAVAIGVPALAAVGFLLLIGAFDFTPQAAVPTAGILIGGAMTAATLTGRRLVEGLEDARGRSRRA